MKKWVLVAALAGAAGGYFAGVFHERQQGEAAFGGGEDKSSPLVSFAGGTLTERELRDSIERLPVFRQSEMVSADRVREQLDALIRTKLLSREAQKRGLHAHHRVNWAAKEAMAQLLLGIDSGEAAIRSRLTEQALRGYYEAHRNDYERPERLRLSHIFFAARADGGEQSEKQRLAKQALAEIQKTREDPSAFGRIARAQSEDVSSRSVDGVLDFMTKEEMSVRFGPEFAEAAWALRPIGATSGVVRSGSGFHILKSLSLDSGTKMQFDQARDLVLERLVREEQARRTEEFMSELERRYEAKPDEGAISDEARKPR